MSPNNNPTMHSHRRLLYLTVTFLAALISNKSSLATDLSAGKAKGLLLWEEFQSDPSQRGWTQAALPGQQFQGEWTSDGEVKYVTAKSGYWESPSFEVQPFQYYRMRFQSRAAKNGFCWARFYDCNGNELVADDHENFWASSDWSEQEFYFRAHASASSVRLRLAADQSSIDVSRVTLHTASEGEVRAWQSRVWSGMPKLEYSPPSERGEFLPITAARLKDGGVLRVVMLGDSICNDTSNSLFETQLRKYYPSTHFQIISSVRGGTLCPWYQSENRVQEYVLRFNPDLLIIAGISHGNDVEAIRNVLRQVREKSKTDILLLSDSVTPEKVMAEGYLKYSGLPEERALSNIRTFPSRLRGMAHMENAQLLDMRAAWNEYVSHSNHPVEWFMRDPIHANARGKQVVGSILARYLAFVKP